MANASRGAGVGRTGARVFFLLGGTVIALGAGAIAAAMIALLLLQRPMTAGLTAMLAACCVAFLGFAAYGGRLAVRAARGEARAGDPRFSGGGTPRIPLSELRETLFGDMPASSWPADERCDGDPWDRFVRARAARDPAVAIRALRAVIGTPGLESRHYLQAWAALRGLGERPDDATAKTVLGVVVEVPSGAGLDVLAAYADRSARYLNHSGSAIIWERPDARLDDAITSLLEAGQRVAHQIGPWEGPRPPPPPSGVARLNLLTPSGLHFGQAPFDVLARDPLGGAVIAAATALLQKITAIDRGGGQGAGGNASSRDA